MRYDYAILTPPIGVAEAEKLGTFLHQYAIQIGGLSVRHRREDGTMTVDNPTACTISQVASAGVIDIALAPAAPVVAAAATVALGPFTLPVALVTLVANIGLLHKNNKSLPADPKAIESEIRFYLANVTPDWLGWVEYLMAAFVTLHKWHKLDGIRIPAQAERGAKYALTYGRCPPPTWGKHAAPYRHGKRH